MLTNRYLVFSLIIAATAAAVHAQIAQEPNATPSVVQQRTSPGLVVRGTSEKLFSPSVSQIFYQIGQDIAAREDANRTDADQAIVLLNAASALDPKAAYLMPDLLKIASRPTDENRSRLVHDLFIEYADERADLEIADKAIRYLLEQLNVREQRQMMIATLYREVGTANRRIASQLNTLYALLLAEMADDPNAARTFSAAYQLDMFNQLAFVKLGEVMRTSPSPPAYLQYLRYRLRENPFDGPAAAAYADTALKTGLFDIAASAHEYLADLYGYINSSDVLPSAIYLPWLMSCYNSQANRHECIRIVEKLRQQNQFDLIAEALAAKAVSAMGDSDKAESMLKAAEEKAIQSVAASGKPGAEELAGFYAFVRPDPNAAVNWANRAYAAEPNSAAAAGLLAYALVMNSQIDAARPLIDAFGSTQIAAEANAIVMLAAGKKDAAIEILRAAVDADPGTLAAEKAKEILARNGAPYVPLYDPEATAAALRAGISEPFTQQFLRPEQIISVQLTLRGDKFSYGTDFGGTVAVTNTGAEPLVITGDSLFKGTVRVDAEVSGDLTASIPSLALVRTRPSQLIESGNSALVPVRLNVGRLRQILSCHPQASLNIQFTVYLDPVVSASGEVACGTAGVEPAVVTIERAGLQVTREFLQNRMNSLAWGRQSQKIKTAELFAGLLMEEQLAADNPPSYKFAYADWMPVMFKAAIVQNLTADDWVVRTHAIASILDMSLDFELVNAVSVSLSDENWPARMMALYALAHKQGAGFGKVLDFATEHDTSEHVRGMARALGGTLPLLPPNVQPDPNRPANARPASNPR